MPASSTKSDSSIEYMSGCAMPVSPSTSSMPFSFIVTFEANSDEKLMLPFDRSRFFPSCFLSLSFAVMEMTLAPAAAKRERIVSPRSSSGPVITIGLPVAVSR